MESEISLLREKHNIKLDGVARGSAEVVGSPSPEYWTQVTIQHTEPLQVDHYHTMLLNCQWVAGKELILTLQ